MEINEFILSSQVLTDFEFESPKEYKVRAILLLVNNDRMIGRENERLLGLTMKNWVLNSLSNLKVKEVKYREKDDALQLIKPLIEDEDFTIVLFSDTPLITENTVFDALEYAEAKDLDLCKLPRGFIVKSQNLKSGKIFLSAEPNFLNKEDFFCVFDQKTLCKAKEVLKNRILDFHLKNGVQIEDRNSVIVDFTVKIGKNVVLGPFNVLKGPTIIEDGVVLEQSNLIEDSVVKKGSQILFSCVKNSVVAENSKVGPFKNLEKK